MFDKEIIKLTGKDCPNFLFIGLANRYPDYYFEVMNGIYHNCHTDHLTYTDIKSRDTLIKKIQNADIIYVGGGNTYKLMTLFRMYGIDEMLRKAYDENKVLCGVSAGAICWCKFGNSDSRKLSSGSNQLIRVKGLGFVDVLFCPHINKEPFRIEDLKNMMKRTYKVPAIALDNAALEIVDNKYKILFLDKGATAQKYFWKNGKYTIENIDTREFRDIKELVTK